MRERDEGRRGVEVEGTEGAEMERADKESRVEHMSRRGVQGLTVDRLSGRRPAGTEKDRLRVRAVRERDED